MSLLRFHRETSQAMRSIEEADQAQRTLMAQESVRDQWLLAREYRPIVTATLGNWTSGDCVDFMTPISRGLIEAGDAQLHRHLWTRTVKRQMDSFFMELSYLRKRDVTYDILLSTNCDSFNPFDIETFETDHRAGASFFLRRLIGSLVAWREELKSAGWSWSEPEALLNAITTLKRPQLSVNKI